MPFPIHMKNILMLHFQFPEIIDHVLDGIECISNSYEELLGWCYVVALSFLTFSKEEEDIDESRIEVT